MSAVSSLQSAIRCFEADRESAAISSLRSALEQLDPSGISLSEPVAAIHAAIKGYERGNDQTALMWARTALSRLQAA